MAAAVFPARNTSCTDLLALLESKWFGNLSVGASLDDFRPASPAWRRPASQLTNSRHSGSSERLLVGSGDNSLGSVAAAFPPSGAVDGSEPQPQQRLAQQQPGYGTQQLQGQQQQLFQPPPPPPQISLQSSRTRSGPLPANGFYTGEVANPAGPPTGPVGTSDGSPPFNGTAPIGTWANRQRVFTQQQAKQAAATAANGLRAAPIAEEEGPSSSTAHAGGAAAFMRLPPSPGAATCTSGELAAENAAAEQRVHGRDHLLQAQQQGPEVDEEDEVNAAWRWRFARKWQTEQAKQFDPEYGREGGDDEWGDALGYMEALANGLNLQIARTISTEQYASLPLVSPTLSNSMLLDASIKESPLTSTTLDDASSMNATKHIVAVARRAQQLFKQQQEIERQVEQRWESATAGQPWVGQHLAAVTMDSWGRFPYVLVRLADRSNRHKLLVRGRNGMEEAAMFAQLEQEVSRAAVQHRLPGPRLELLGSGTMEWSRERDRCLNITACKLHSLTDARLRSKGDVSKLAGALAQSSLPVSYKILVEGKPFQASPP
ncbi:hypothetical protein N2152v2_002439 [Parachlorella kessleri]